ncbi:hypothetical protein KY285_023735 [Solanum tuberosum]|nr:hypothetical protein KY289_025756 [Solanum tuberosum]KAH0675934.1 hypothetical protein KY285_023735 [Solanum tuberosum]
MEEIETQMDTNDQFVDAFSVVIGPEHPGCLRLYGVGVTKTTLKRKAGNSEQSLNDTNDLVQQMQERIQKMEKQMEEQKKTVRQEVITDQHCPFLLQEKLVLLHKRLIKVMKLKKEMKAVLKT